MMKSLTSCSKHFITIEYKRHLSTTSNSQTPNSTMAKTKELSKDTRNKIVDLYQAGKTESAIDTVSIPGLPGLGFKWSMINQACSETVLNCKK
ncbi:hypothetical protein QTP86_004400 [Hemibagrus guttatus]|nr:hypothetical protein QTP86_004400 [Hemibagrus guttatus]